MPLQTPANYLLDLPNPAEQVQKDLQFYMNMQEAQARNNMLAAQVQEHQLNVQKVQTAQARQAQMQAMAQELNANPSVDGVRRMMAAFPEIADKYKELLTSYTDEQKQNLISQNMQLVSAITRGDIPTATKLLDMASEASKKAGRAADAAGALSVKDSLAKGDVAGALAGAAGFVAAAAGPEKAAEVFDKIRNSNETAAKAIAERKTAEVEAEKRGEKLSAEIRKDTTAATANIAQAGSANATAAQTRQATKFAADEQPFNLLTKISKAQEAGTDAATKAFDLGEKQKMAPDVRAKTAAEAKSAGARARSDEIAAQVAEQTAIDKAREELKGLKTGNDQAKVNLDRSQIALDVARKTELPLALSRVAVQSVEESIVKQYGMDKARIANEREQLALNIAKDTGLPMEKAKLLLMETDAKIRKQYGGDLAAADLKLKQEQAKDLDARTKKLLATQELDRQLTEADLQKRREETNLIRKELKTLPASTATQLFKVNEQGQAAADQAFKVQTLLNDFSAANRRGDISSGWWARVKESGAKLMGREDTVSSLINRIDEVQNKAAMDLLPPGAASDADLAFARAAFMHSTGDPAQIEEALRRMVRGLKRVSALSRDYSEWGSTNTDFGAAREPMRIGGRPVLPGETWLHYQERVYGVQDTTGRAK